jgi:aminoglycoside/choline kinase family phosphotransferase
MDSSSLATHTRTRFELIETEPIIVEPIDKGGSDRKFYRIRLGASQSVILVKYSAAREENLRYAQIALFLNSLGVRVPQIYYHDQAEGLLWMEDLGDRDLFSFQSETWDVRRRLYESALNEVHILHREGMQRLADAGIPIEKEFDAQLYLWEQRYFFENCLRRHFDVAPQEIEPWLRHPSLVQAAEELGARPRVLVHRDFQSQNIIIREGAAALIDFQGLRPGLAAYDIASLLYDPYVELSEQQRGELAGYYLEGAGSGEENFLHVLRLCAMQRLMQALGAYGFLGIDRGKTGFLKFIPRALDSLVCVTAEVPILRDFSEWLRHLQPEK